MGALDVKSPMGAGTGRDGRPYMNRPPFDPRNALTRQCPRHAVVCAGQAAHKRAKPSTCYLIGPPVAVMCGGYHWAYDLGMPRLSCMFCVLTSESAHVLAAQYNPRGAAKRLAAGAKRCGGGVSKGQRVIAVSG